MLGLVGQEAPFDHGREQMKLLAGLKVTAKAVERTAEAIGADIALIEQAKIKSAMQLNLPIVICGWRRSPWQPVPRPVACPEVSEPRRLDRRAMDCSEEALGRSRVGQDARVRASYFKSRQSTVPGPPLIWAANADRIPSARFSISRASAPRPLFRSAAEYSLRTLPVSG